MLTVWTHAIYLALSLGMTILAARSLKRNGRVFLLKTFDGDESLANAINNLLVVGFYLVNIGWVLMWTKYGDKPSDMNSLIEFVTTKVGAVTLILGVVHILNMRVFWKIQKSEVPMPVPPIPNYMGINPVVERKVDPS